MTVKELIAKLETFNPDSEILIQEVNIAQRHRIQLGVKPENGDYNGVRPVLEVWCDPGAMILPKTKHGP